MPRCCLMYPLWFYHGLTRVLTAKKISGLVLTKYMRDPMSCLYKVGSTSLSSDASIIFQLVIMGVDMGLQSCILNLFRISIAYLPCPRKIPHSFAKLPILENSASTPYPSCQILLQGSSCSLLWNLMILSKSDHPHTKLEMSGSSSTIK